MRRNRKCQFFDHGGATLSVALRLNGTLAAVVLEEEGRVEF